jgi:hypothetical protein
VAGGERLDHPTDSSINIAIGQGHHPPPHGLSLEAQDSSGAGSSSRRTQVRPAEQDDPDRSQSGRAGGVTSLTITPADEPEIYWDWLAVADDVPNAMLRRQGRPGVADLRFRGFLRRVTRRDARKRQLTA